MSDADGENIRVELYPPTALPDELRRELPTDKCQSLPKTRGYLRWDSRDEAMAALSLACVNYGRQMAGLEPLALTPGGRA